LTRESWTREWSFFSISFAFCVWRENRHYEILIYYFKYGKLFLLLLLIVFEIPASCLFLPVVAMYGLNTVQTKDLFPISRHNVIMVCNQQCRHRSLRPCGYYVFAMYSVCNNVGFHVNYFVTGYSCFRSTSLCVH